LGSSSHLEASTPAAHAAKAIMVSRRQKSIKREPAGQIVGVRCGEGSIVIRRKGSRHAARTDKTRGEQLTH